MWIQRWAEIEIALPLFVVYARVFNAECGASFHVVPT